MKKVMIADDEQNVRTALQLLIPWEELGCKIVYAAKNGSEVLNALEEYQPDILVTDIKMPVTDGLEVARQLSEKKSGISVILLTAYAEFEYARQALQYHVSEYIVKTAVLEQLPDAIKRVCARLDERAGRVLTDGLFYENARPVLPASDNRRNEDRLVQEVNEYIADNYCSRIALADMARTLHINKSYLSHIYKEKTGKNIFDVINEKRLEAAKKLIRQTDLRLNEIALRVGFDDAAYFSRFFRKYTGMSPKDYKCRTHGREDSL